MNRKAPVKAIRILVSLEAVSKPLHKHHNEGNDNERAVKVRVPFPSDEASSVLLKPRENALDFPAFGVSAKRSSVLDFLSPAV